MPDQEPTQPDQPASNSAADAASDLPEVYELETLEQLRAIADELRTRIAEALTHRAMTVTQLGELLGQAPAKIHYHVRELERVGLVRLVATREKSGILEKYYRAIARTFTASKTLLTNAPTDEAFAAMRTFLDNTSRAFLRASEYTFRHQLWDNPKMWGLSSTQVWVTQDEMKALIQRVQAEFDQYAVRRGVEGEEERTIVMMGYDPRIEEEQRAGEEPVPLASSALPNAPGARRVRPRYMVIAGSHTLRRWNLEAVIAENRQLDISSIGVCTFADDITPELIEQAISHFRYRGKVIASPAIRDALKRKEK